MACMRLNLCRSNSPLVQSRVIKDAPAISDYNHFQLLQVKISSRLFGEAGIGKLLSLVRVRGPAIGRLEEPSLVISQTDPHSLFLTKYHQLSQCSK